MKQSFCAIIGDARGTYSHVYVIASAKEEARRFVEQLLADRKPLGFSEAQMRKLNPKRAPWKPGLCLLITLGGTPVDDSRKLGIVLENEDTRASGSGQAETEGGRSGNDGVPFLPGARSQVEGESCSAGRGRGSTHGI